MKSQNQAASADKQCTPTTDLNDYPRPEICRPCSLEIRLQSDIDKQDLAMRLVRTVPAIFRSQAEIDQFEFLSYPDKDGQQTYVVSVTVPTLPKTIQRQSTLDGSLSNARKPVPGSRAHATVCLQNILEDKLPGDVDIQPVWLDFSPLGESVASTCRLLTRENRRVAMAEPFDRPLSPAVLERLNETPHLYQALINNHSANEFNLSARVALFGRNHQTPTESVLAETVRHGREFYPGTQFPSLTSNFGAFEEDLVPIGDYVAVVADEVSEPDRVKALTKGHPEYWDLLQRRMGVDTAYSELGYYPKTVVRERDLQHFLGLTPAVTDAVWTEAPGREPPVTRPIEVVEPSTTASSTGVTTPDEEMSPTATESVTPGGKEGNATHQKGERSIEEILEARGFVVVRIDQYTEGSVPDRWALSPTGEIYAVEVENRNKTKPASLLINAIRAAQWGVRMLVVTVAEDNEETTESAEKKAQKAAETLQEPFRATVGYRTRLYNRSDDVETGEGGTLLLPDGVTEAPWWLTPDGTLQLRIDGTVRATGHAEEPLASFDNELPRYSEQNGNYVVERADGTVLHRYDTEEALNQEWTRLSPPLVPTRLHYLDLAELMYLDEERKLQEFRLDADWDIPPHEKRYKKGLATHADLYLLCEEEARTPLEEYRSHAQDWMRRLTNYKEPNDSYFEQCRPEYNSVELRANSSASDVGKYRFFEGLTWRYPRGLVAPGLPDLSGGPTYPDEWDDEETDDDAAETSTEEASDRDGEGDSQADDS